ncbi:hypothetical protein PAEPH01_2824 [Pancytospora epiphaga]|nr:hypothetical protein PAEPH01_2824 [Pancytospora epiphaga]
MLTVTVPLFSKADLCSQKHVFRAPGGIISTRPTLRLHSSILTEQGILYYFNVSNENQSSWFIRKDLGNCKDVSTTVNRLNGLPDSEFNRFIVSDVVSIVFRRTSYIYYNNRIMILRLMESSLCVCDCKKIVNVVRLDDVSIVKLDGSRPSFVVGETAFGCSCVIERDEWVSCIEKIVNGKC